MKGVGLHRVAVDQHIRVPDLDQPVVVHPRHPRGDDGSDRASALVNPALVEFELAHQL
jgi:hypothetical protein